MKLTWFGHAAFRLEFGDTVILIDPYLKDNPSFDRSFDEATAGTTHVLLTHGHSDHVGDTLEIAKHTRATVIANFDLLQWLIARGLETYDPLNTGGTVRHDGFSVSLTQAFHSSGNVDENGIAHSLGFPNGIILTAEGEPVVYHMGDTDIFGDMTLIEEIYKPEIGLVPIGDRFTMNAKVAALACKRFFNFSTIVPCHYGTFPLLAPNAEEFLSLMEGHRVIAADVGAPLQV
jgi:L-ascorbate metabolism protein UlaG (beta-lactamase superfamily)